ncbi:mycofactocin system transcriptional regulator [Pseudoclavibacter endophyticus]|uniref:Mycofactocin system transcriptional regulator n=2 Tax=Pseudoclavibacter endophyticus TaxID=1778590 RepID=A0A6H9WKI7_9MICO|nr:mycofactocin system transcriptional regulator [Pseudoclavibacter endophyticus]KAB1649663.1 mycofactocin system transcriptional regulator [Pseudoclavibacter endophyticus]GGA60829.1 mycofactocin system transcriptional regulator [Pseudoclavibacter endophyticus]
MKTTADSDRATGGGAARPRTGRAKATTAAELERIGLDLFVARGFDAVTVDDIASAAGIGRRTFFRYYASKNDLPWGDFDGLLRGMRENLDAIPEDVPLAAALRQAIIDFNAFPASDMAHHRRRMRVLLESQTLVAHSALRYADWRRVVSDFSASRLALHPDHVLPNVIGRVCLAISLASYEQWLHDEKADLPTLIAAGFKGLGAIFAAHDEEVTRAHEDA